MLDKDKDKDKAKDKDFNGNQLQIGSGMAIDIEKLKLILENLNGAFFFTENDDTEVHLIYSSLSLTNPFSSTDSENHNEGQMLPEDADLLRSMIINASHTLLPFELQYRLHNINNEIEWRLLHSVPLPDTNQKLHLTLNTITDITQIKKAEAAQQEKDRIIDFAMKNTDVNMWYFDYESSQCQLTSSCQKAHEMVGVEVLDDFPECLIKTGYVRDDCVELLRESYKKLCLTGESLEFDVWFKKQNGTGWWCERDMLSPLVGSDGKVTRGIGIGKNVTAEKEMEEKYHAFQSYRILAEKSTVLFARMNLTTNRCGDCSSSLYEFDPALITTPDGFLSAVKNAALITEGDTHMGNLTRQELIEMFLAGKSTISFEYRAAISDTHSVWLRSTVDMMKNPATEDIEAIYYIVNIDYEKNTAFVVDQLLSTDYEFLGLFEAVSGHLLVFGDNKDVGGMARNNSIYDSEIPRIFRSLIHDEYYDEAIRNTKRQHIINELETKEYYTCSYPTRPFGNAKAGRKQWKFAYLDKSKTQILMTRTDITDIYTAERDELTGLYNRNAFYNHAREMLLKNPKEHFVLIRADIDRFKAYNDLRGTKAGDKLLAEFGKEMRRRSWPELAIFGHLEADHFCVLFPKNHLSLDLRISNYQVWLDKIVPGYRLISSIGIYDITDHDLDVSLMCDRALLALKTVKDTYGTKIAWYDESLRRQLRSEQALIEDMEQALLQEQFVIYLQPQIDYVNNSLIGAEALVRWKHPSRGLIPPGDFIPLFEKNGFIIQLDSYVWEKACMQLRHWIDKGYKQIVPISVNISRYDIEDPTVCDRLLGLVHKYDLSPMMLKLEITESAYMENPEKLLEMASRLQSMGFTVEMDDFGAGYSSLNTLKDVSVDVLKLDMRFLSKGWDDARGGLILSSVIRMARWLGLPVIAEGVETKNQAEYLKSLSCHYMQGYLFAKPMPIEEFEQSVALQSTGLLATQGGFDEANSIWGPASHDSLLFSQLIGGAALLEYDGETAEILRTNDRFFTELGTTRGEYQDSQGHTLDRFKEPHRNRFKKMLDEAIQTGKDAECDVESLPHRHGTESFYTHNSVHLLSGSDNRFLLYLEVKRLATAITQPNEDGDSDDNKLHN